MSKLDTEREKQTVKLYEKLKVFSGGVITDVNLLSSIIFGMKELKEKKLPGEDKKSLVTQVILTIIQESVGSEMGGLTISPERIETMIEDLYIGGRKMYKRSRWCCCCC